jgi:hypothetical protein
MGQSPELDCSHRLTVVAELGHKDIEGIRICQMSESEWNLHFQQKKETV